MSEVLVCISYEGPKASIKGVRIGRAPKSVIESRQSCQPSEVFLPEILADVEEWPSISSRHES